MFYATDQFENNKDSLVNNLHEGDNCCEKEDKTEKVGSNHHVLIEQITSSLIDKVNTERQHIEYQLHQSSGRLTKKSIFDVEKMNNICPLSVKEVWIPDAVSSTNAKFNMFSDDHQY